MNMINTYGYMVLRNKRGIPLHFVEIYHNMACGISVFNTAKDAKEFISREKESLSLLDYDPDFYFCSSIVDIYQKADNLKSRLCDKQIYI